MHNLSWHVFDETILVNMVSFRSPKIRRYFNARLVLEDTFNSNATTIIKNLKIDLYLRKLF